ncbi:hypothetical protein [Bifidobacterium eulemuris]|uniref:Uncharacterized protein n=1 Tax=Bifidobacterium eulemuris TaxID=1765219 RepID=A0A261FZA7_9BIFI|nr:hypothetical protein [Bifidobacterium eulemuris]OZG64253.1 hypothetical protein BEUL_2214 [Bifidobacterium eulemuris]QOL32820.1 hypothetical protein BE0216_10530 [Bifidobacterium eulemuris]
MSKKKIGAGNILLALSALFSLAGTVVYIVNATGSYYGDFALLVPVLGLATLVLIVAPIVLETVVGDRQWIDACYPIAGVLGIAAMVQYIAARAESVALILGSSLEAGNTAAHQALYTAFAGIACYLLAVVAVCAAGFFNRAATSSVEVVSQPVTA